MTDAGRVLIAGPVFTERYRYERSGGELLVTQVASAADDVTPPDCDLHDGTPFVGWHGPCRTARTPRICSRSPMPWGPWTSRTSIGSGEDLPGVRRCLVQVALRSHDRPAEHLAHRLRRLRLRLLSRLAI
jgi:hypothetical protein